MKFGILANERSWYFRDLQRAASLLGHTCQRLDFERLMASVGRDFRISIAKTQDESTETAYVRSTDLDVVIVRTMPPGSLEQVVYRMDVLGQLELLGTQVVNSPKSLECAVDKFLTTVRLQRGGLPVPQTIVCEHEDDAMLAFEVLGRDVVVKPLFGSEGRGILRVTDPDLAFRTFRTLMRTSSVLYLQRFIDHEGYDVRVVVLNGRVLGGMRRRSVDDFRTNVARNAVAEPHSTTELEAHFAIQAARLTGTVIAGVDLLYDREGNCHVVEVNAVPGWQAFTKVTGIDVAAEFIRELSENNGKNG